MRRSVTLPFWEVEEGVSLRFAPIRKARSDTYLPPVAVFHHA